ncbi:uncharacterized protein LOC113228734 [Hyposmocoma kahamanoa]|uniref:uncharacterized protein LOC113228734 n=1 Tax=Hyposmocoma kahamanoa TaxID=1477025 RepID=UPI000E6D6A8A|nr:uncharacterized protein LOC113228734 [Hyposmocoma kahamanoa]
MYEISPYATFSMAAGAGAGAERAEEPLAAGTLRTFGRAEALALGAAPPQRLRSHKHRSPANSDEYTLSRAMTLMVRPSESDSESSGSPCAECNSSSASYRMPVAPSKEEVFRAVTDSSAESGDARSVQVRHERVHDKRRRPRRHHTPTSSRYQQRQEQERRDFTIHV